MEKPRKYNVVADFLSRLKINNEDTPVEYSLPNEHLFSISTRIPWYADISNYIAAGNVPHHLPHKEQWIIIQQSAYYT